MSYKILVVEDEPDLREMLENFFRSKGFNVLAASCGEDALLLAAENPDLILLDVNMPGMDGYTLCKALRDGVSCPILFLTARVEDADKITGFAAGGDDYITKPFSTSELLARVNAHLRREERHGLAGRVRFSGGLAIDYTQRSVLVAGEPVQLVKKEFDILELLSLHPGQVFDKERIYERIWGYDSEGSSAVVVEYIRRLRSKLAGVGCGDRIETVWGVGYKWKK